jgi:hypothetical protein
MTDSFYNIVSWVMILFGLVGALAMLGLCFWLINEEMNK